MPVVADVKSKLATLDQVYTILQHTEPLSVVPLDSSTAAKFKLDPDWALDTDALQGTDTVGAYITVGSTEQQLTKEAVFQAAANFGLTGAYIKRIPAHFTESLLNYHFGAGMGDSEFKLLSVKGNAAAFVKPTIQPYSNLALLDQAVDGIKKFYGEDTEILADYKITNSLVQTDVRLIVPETFRTILHGGMTDVPSGQTDLWSAGIHVSNSAVGRTQTGIDAYLFRWWCTNGATVEYDAVGKWNRRKSTDQDVYEWARDAVDEILGGLETRFEEVQALTSLKTASNTGDIFREIFADYTVPKSQQGEITENILAQDTLSMYTIMNAITQSANGEIESARADKLMRIGGHIPTHTFDTLKAQVWAEGHKAEPTAVNPYVPVVEAV